VEIELFRLERPLSPTLARWLTDTLRRHRIELAHSHEFTMAVYGSWAARRAGVPHLFTMHGSRYYAARLQRRIAMCIAARLSGSVIAVSQILSEHLRRDLWLRTDRVVTIPNGARHTPPPGAHSSLRQELGLAADDQLAVSVGNLYPVKGHAFLLEALSLLSTRFPRLHVAIAGRGELEETLLARARALDLANRFHLLGLRADVGNVLAAADVFVLPSLSEGVPLALLEAMMAARPIVATAVGEVPTVLDGGRAGVLAPPGDAAALATAMATVLSDPNRARQLATTAAARAAARYTFNAMVDRYVALYAKLLLPSERSHFQPESLEIATPKVQ
jgi:glycosyltransferase involved in cell wall biosynthesis